MSSITCASKGAAKKAVKCPLYDVCAYQRQKRIEANIWFAAHECAVHEMPKAFGKVGWVIIDESPLDAFMFGVDNNDQIDAGARRPAQPADTRRSSGSRQSCCGREGLYHAALDRAARCRSISTGRAELTAVLCNAFSSSQNAARRRPADVSTGGTLHEPRTANASAGVARARSTRTSARTWMRSDRCARS